MPGAGTHQAEAARACNPEPAIASGFANDSRRVFGEDLDMAHTVSAWRRCPLRVAMWLCMLFGSGAAASADPIRVEAQIVRPGGAALADLPVRIVVGGEKNPRLPDAGQRLRTDPGGRIVYVVEAPVESRSVTLDNPIIRHPARRIEVGIEMDLLGRRALYWIEIDLVKAGARAGMGVFLQSSSGRFDRRLTFHSRNHSWSFPDQPGGMMLSGIGAELRDHDMSGSSTEGWTVRVQIEKSEFQMR